MFLKSLYQNGLYLENGRPPKISLFQSYEELWIHVVDMICIFLISGTFGTVWIIRILRSYDQKRLSCI